jgi:hypothetical protein
LGERLKKLLKPEAEKRKKSTLNKGSSRCGNLPPRETGKTRDAVGMAIGMSGKTYEKALAVVQAARVNPELMSCVEEMDRTGNSALRKAPGAFSSSPSIKTAESALSITSPIVVRVPGDRPPKNTSRRSHLQEHGRSLI